jgi:hypothetical protein
MEHPIHELRCEDGMLFEKPPRGGGGPARPYMADPDIAITEKISAAPASVGREGSFSFRLNQPPSPIWQKLFRENLGEYPELMIERDHLHFRCNPNDLRAQYGRVKDAVDKTNADYRVERDLVTTRVQEEQRRRAEETKAAGDRADVIRQKFDDLKL